MENIKKSPFIVFEGIDGSGKSTQLKRLKNRLREEDIPVYTTMEPTDSPIGGVIRQILTGRVQADGRVIALLFAADRLDHITNPVNGLARIIESGRTVLCDRYYLSSYAYHAADMPMEQIIEANAISRETLSPDAHIFIDTPVEVVMERIRRRAQQRELFEKESRLIATRENYFKAFELLKDKENIIIIKGNQPPGAIEEAVWEAVNGFFNN